MTIIIETKRRHYNPCFWTAHWNPSYYTRSLADALRGMSARKQTVHALNVKSCKIISTAVERVHFDKTPGMAEITREAAEKFCAKHHPNHLEEFKARNRDARYPVAIDPEQLFGIIESLPCYETLLKVIRRQSITTAEEKCFLAGFVYLQFIRSHAIMNASLEWHADLGIDQFESFVTLKWNLESSDFWSRAILPLVFCKWVLFATEADVFPLCDSPILCGTDSVTVALSPRLLLKMYPGIRSTEHQWMVKRGIKPSNLAEFRRRTIGNTFREIIFSNREVLEYWQNTPEFSARAQTIKAMTSYNRIAEKNAERDRWELNVHTNKQ